MILSVVVAAKDAPERLLNCCLASFARLNSAADIEIVIVNSGIFPAEAVASTDMFGGFRVVEMAPQGVYAAFNRGVAEAQGRYLLFFGVDDIALPGMDAVIARLRDTEPVYDLFAAATYMQGHGISAPTGLRPAILFRNWCQQSLFYSRDYIRSHPFDLRYRTQADHKANIEILANKSLRFGMSGELVSYFSDGGMSQTSYDLPFRRDMPRIASENFGRAYGLIVAVKQRLANLIKGSPEDRR